MFPQGLVGAGLLLMRLSSAVAVGAAFAFLAPAAPWAIAGGLILATSLLLGLATRFAAVAGATLAVLVAFHTQGSCRASGVLIGVDLLALMLMGPGAYSIDARLFGRKVIVVRRPDGP